MHIIPGYDALEDVRTLFGEYADWLGVSLCFQSFEQELAALPGRYALPGGRLYLAMEDNKAAGCVALRPLDGGTAEMKRLYVRPEYRSRGLGEALTQRIIQDAVAIGYRRIVLDTLVTMQPAIRLYKKLGFDVIEPYYDNPIEGAVYLGVNLVNYTAVSEAE